MSRKCMLFQCLMCHLVRVVFLHKCMCVLLFYFYFLFFWGACFCASNVKNLQVFFNVEEIFGHNRLTS